MNTTLKQKLTFRINRSREKLNLALLMMDKGDFTSALINAYLSVFYSARLLLINTNHDSDDNDRIIELLEKYYEPMGWTDIDVNELFKGIPDYDNLDKTNSKKVDPDMVKRFYSDAKILFDKILDQFSATY